MKVHFVGIGGIGVSALARYFVSTKHEVSGSDIADSALVQDLGKEGIEISIGTDSKYVPDDVDKVIYSVAVKEDNPELVKAKKLGVPVLSYAQALGEITKKHFTIAITGSHGKSTTTSITALMMVEAGFDPTLIVGTKLAEFGGTNFRKGESEYLVIEADDYDRSFWNYKPNITVVLNVDEEHLDTYGNIDGVVDGFHQYLKNLPVESKAILNSKDPYTSKIEKDLKCEVIHFNNEGEILQWPLQIPGDFNQVNTEAAWQAVKQVGVTKNDAENAVSKFKGVWRRLEALESKLEDKGDSLFFSDYGHHPTEVAATLRALKERYSDRKLTVVFQPHQERRLTELFDQFKVAFDAADRVILMPVYKVTGRDSDGGRTSLDLQKAISNKDIEYVESFKEALALLKEGVVVFMGAGDIDSQVRESFRSKLLT